MYYEIATLHEEPQPVSVGSDVVEQHDVALPETGTVGASVPFIHAVETPLDERVPLSFLNALADFNAGRVVAVDVALTQIPSGA
jgi:hypothetical protein